MNAEEVVNLLDLEDSDSLASYRSECFDLLQCTDKDSILGELPTPGESVEGLAVQEKSTGPLPISEVTL